MAQPSRDDAVATLEEGDARLRSLIARAPEADLTRPGTIGEWSVADLLEHIATWERLALRTLEEWRRGERPWVEGPEGPFSGGPEAIDAFNARTVKERRSSSADEARRNYEATHRRLIEEISRVPDETWRSKAGYETAGNRRRTLVALVGSILGAPAQPFAHAFAHLPDLERYVSSAG